MEFLAPVFGLSCPWPLRHLEIKPAGTSLLFFFLSVPLKYFFKEFHRIIVIKLHDVYKKLTKHAITVNVGYMPVLHLFAFDPHWEAYCVSSFHITGAGIWDVYVV